MIVNEEIQKLTEKNKELRQQIKELKFTKKSIMKEVFAEFEKRFYKVYEGYAFQKFGVRFCDVKKIMDKMKKEKKL